MGTLWACVLFASMVRLWLSDLMYRARFASADKVHKTLDLLGYLLVVFSANSIASVLDYYDDTRFFEFYVYHMLAIGLWCARHLEIALASRDEPSRRYASGLLVDEGGTMVIWTFAYFFGGKAGNSEDQWQVDVQTALLLGIGAVWPELRSFWRSKRLALIPGDWLPRSITRTPFNVEFCVHRFNEFMMLMVGETVLQLVLAEPTESADAPSNTEAHVRHAVMVALGFTISVSMLYSFNIKEPHHARGHAYARTTAAGISYTILFVVKSCAVLLTGIGVKIAIYNPFEPADSPRAPAQRTQFSFAIGLCFALQLIMRPLHLNLSGYYSLTKFRRQPTRTLVIALRFCTIGGMFAMSSARLAPSEFVLCQAALAALENALSAREPKPIKTSPASAERSVVRSAKEAAVARSRRRSRNRSSSGGSDQGGSDAAADLPPKSPGGTRPGRVGARTSSFSGLAIMPSPRSPMRMMSKKSSKKWPIPAQNAGDA